jgi:hypothetical protein
LTRKVYTKIGEIHNFFEDSYTPKNIGVSSRENGMVRYFAALAESF